MIAEAALENLAEAESLAPDRLQELIKVFRQATELEIAFWDSALASVSGQQEAKIQDDAIAARVF